MSDVLTQPLQFTDPRDLADLRTFATRARAVDAAGGNGFVSVSAAHAAVRLAQGAGRLIRATGDRGVVAVLDSRLATARYGGFLRDSLPDFWSTTSTPTVLEALRRLGSGV